MMSMHGLEENHQTPPDLLRRVNAHTPKVGRIFQRMYRRGFEPSQVSFIDLFIHPVETKGKQFKVPVHTGREGITKYFPSEGAAIAFAFQADRILRLIATFIIGGRMLHVVKFRQWSGNWLH